MPTHKLHFPGSLGHKLAARLDLPDRAEPRAFVQFAHHFLGSLAFKPYAGLTLALTSAGFGVFRLDFTGLGHSEGDFAETTFSTNVDDFVCAAQYLGREFDSPQVLLGHSLGGAAVLQAAARIPTARAVATIGAPFSPAHVAHLFGAAAQQIVDDGQATLMLAGRRVTIRRAFLEDLTRYQADLLLTLRRLQRALLIFHSPHDRTVSIDNAAEIFRAARHPKSFVSLADADHMLLQPRDATYVGAITAAWAARYVDDALSSTGKELEAS